MSNQQGFPVELARNCRTSIVSNVPVCNLSRDSQSATFTSLYLTSTTIISTTDDNNKQDMSSTSNNDKDTDTAADADAIVATFNVPTKRTDEAPKRVIDTSNLSEEDLEALRKQDPFLYYSIPRVRNATLRSSAVEADLTTQRNQDPKQELAPTRRRASSCPSQVESSSSTMVKRRSCISFERHTDLLLEECMDDAELFGDGDGIELDALVDQMLLRNKQQQ